MKPETLTALKESIKHWERNAFGPIGEASVYSDDCSLCIRFDNDDEFSCTLNGERCPVYERTDETVCRGTPYEGISELLYYARVKGGETAYRNAAKAELEFLKSLLPEGEA